MRKANVTLASGEKLRVEFDENAFRAATTKVFPEIAGERIRVEISPRVPVPPGPAGFMLPRIGGDAHRYLVLLCIDRIAKANKSSQSFLSVCAFDLAHEVGHVLYDSTKVPPLVKHAALLALPIGLLAGSPLYLEDLLPKNLRKIAMCIFGASIALSYFVLLSGFWHNTKGEKFARSFAREQIRNPLTAHFWRSFFKIKEV